MNRYNWALTKMIVSRAQSMEALTGFYSILNSNSDAETYLLGACFTR